MLNKEDLDKIFGKEMWAAGFRYSCRETEAATEKRIGWIETSGLLLMFCWEQQGIR